MPSIPVAAVIAASVIATSSTGGNVAGPGVVIKTGSSYSSSNVTVVSGGQGSTTIDIRTNANGRVREEYREVSNNGAQVSVSVTATSSPAQVEVRVAPPTATSTQSWFKKLFGWGPKPVATTSTATTTATSSIEVRVGGASASLLTNINAWFRSLWSFFR